MSHVGLLKHSGADVKEISFSLLELIAEGYNKIHVPNNVKPHPHHWGP